MSTRMRPSGGLGDPHHDVVLEAVPEAGRGRLDPPGRPVGRVDLPALGLRLPAGGLEHGVRRAVEQQRLDPGVGLALLGGGVAARVGDRVHRRLARRGDRAELGRIVGVGGDVVDRRHAGGLVQQRQGIGQDRQPDEDPRRRAQGERALALQGRAQQPHKARDRAARAADHPPLQDRKAGLEAPPIPPTAEPRQRGGDTAQQHRDRAEEHQKARDVHEPRVVIAGIVGLGHAGAFDGSRSVGASFPSLPRREGRGPRRWSVGG